MIAGMKCEEAGAAEHGSDNCPQDNHQFVASSQLLMHDLKRRSWHNRCRRPEHPRRWAALHYEKALALEDLADVVQQMAQCMESLRAAITHFDTALTVWNDTEYAIIWSDVHADKARVWQKMVQGPITLRIQRMMAKRQG